MREGRYPAWAWFAPALLSGVFLVVLGIMLYVMQIRTADENARSLESDSAAAGDAVRGRLEADRNFILSLSDDLARDAIDEVAFQERVTRYVIDHPEVLSVRWVSPDLIVHRQAPVDPSSRIVGTPVTAAVSSRAIRLAIDGRRSLWTRPFNDPSGNPSFELWVPVIREEGLYGLFGARFSCEGLIRRSMSPPLMLDYRLTVEDGLGGVIVALPSVDRVDPKYSKGVPLDPPGYGISLLMERYGSRLWGWGMIAMAVTCVALASGMGFGMWMLARSIAVRKRAEGALRASNEALVSLLERERMMEDRLRESAKMEAVGRLAGGIAHDFNNLLTAILGYSDLLMHRLPEDDMMRREVGEIQKAGERAAALTRQLLAFGRKQMMQPLRIDLKEVVRGMERMLARLAGENVELTVDEGSGPMTVLADRGQIEQAIVNLVSNARDAMPEGGRLTIAISAEAGDILLSVKDSGRGIDEETRAHLFEPFFTTKERGKGTGMGLPTVYGIVAQSGGRIDVESAPGEGTDIRIRLPSVEPEQAVQGESPRSAPGEPIPISPGKTILLAEDESVIRTLVASILAREGLAVLEAGDGVEALRIAGEQAGPIDLLLTDVMMPRMGGRELADRLVRLRPGTKVLFMSGYPDDALGVEGVMPEKVAFLAKPFTPDAVARKVRDLLEGRPETGIRPG